MRLRIPYIGRVEGEGAVELELGGGLKLKVWEPPRFLEGALRGRGFQEVPDVVARICGICPVSHMLTAIQALEAALGFEPPEGVRLLRRLAALSQVASSHLVHLALLALPDYEAVESFQELLPRRQGLLQAVLRLKGTLNDLTALLAGGRALHPVGLVVGGFSRAPKPQELERMQVRLKRAQRDAGLLWRLFRALRVPELSLRSIPLSLAAPQEYAVNGGALCLGGRLHPAGHYRRLLVEEELSHSFAKRTVLRGSGEVVMVGALARLRNQHGMLPRPFRGWAQGLLREAGQNPFYNLQAQALELYWAVRECRRLLGAFKVGGGLYFRLRGRAGEGLALTEAPRGLLMHRYVLNQKGLVEEAEVVTPTAHNVAALEAALKALLSRHARAGRQGLLRLSGMLVRAFDPCFSCSVH